MCYVLIENYLNGCNAAIVIVGVTTNQNDSYIWLKSESRDFVSRQVKEVPFNAI